MYTHSFHVFPLFSDEEDEVAGGSDVVAEERTTEGPARKRRKELTSADTMCQILEMHRREHELRMKYIQKEHDLRLEEHHVKMEILNRKLMKEQLKVEII